VLHIDKINCPGSGSDAGAKQAAEVVVSTLRGKTRAFTLLFMRYAKTKATERDRLARQ